MKVRHLHETDIEQVLALWNRHLQYDQLSPELLEEKIWDDPDFTKDLAFVVEHEDKVIALAFGVIREVAGEFIGYIKMFVVAKLYHRNKVATRLLDEMEQRFLKLGAKKARLGEAPPNYLIPGLDPRYTKAMVFFESKGYRRFGETWNLDVDLSTNTLNTEAHEQHLAKEGVEIIRATEQDKEAVMKCVEKNWPAWKAEVAIGFNNQPIRIHFARQNGDVIAFAAYDTNNFGTGWFGPMATLKHAQGKGIGGILLKRCLVDIKTQGHRFATIPWVGPIGFYLHHVNAEVARVFYRYEKEL